MVQLPTELRINSTRHAARPTEDWPGRHGCFELRYWRYEDSAGSPPILKCTRPLQPYLCHPNCRYVLAADTNWLTLHSRPCPPAITICRHWFRTRFCHELRWTRKHYWQEQGLANATVTYCTRKNLSHNHCGHERCTYRLSRVLAYAAATNTA